MICEILDNRRIEVPIGPRGRAGERKRAAIHLESEPGLVADRPEEPRGVLDEAEVVQDADRAPAQVAEPAEEVVGRAESLAVGTRAASGHGIAQCGLIQAYQSGWGRGGAPPHGDVSPSLPAA